MEGDPLVVVVILLAVLDRWHPYVCTVSAPPALSGCMQIPNKQSLSSMVMPIFTTCTVDAKRHADATLALSNSGEAQSDKGVIIAQEERIADAERHQRGASGHAISSQEERPREGKSGAEKT